jgi:hypothetical protein
MKYIYNCGEENFVEDEYYGNRFEGWEVNGTF